MPCPLGSNDVIWHRTYVDCTAVVIAARPWGIHSALHFPVTSGCRSMDKRLRDEVAGGLNAGPVRLRV